MNTKQIFNRMEQIQKNGPGKLFAKQLVRPKNIKAGAYMPIKVMDSTLKQEKEITGYVDRVDQGTEKNRFEWMITISFFWENDGLNWRFYIYAVDDQYLEVYNVIN